MVKIIEATGGNGDVSHVKRCLLDVAFRAELKMQVGCQLKGQEGGQERRKEGGCMGEEVLRTSGVLPQVF